jgi:hypothetical protein
VLSREADAGELLTGTTQDTDSPNMNWITLFTEDGGAQIDMLPASSAPGTGTDCATCSGAGYSIPIGAFWGPLGDAGVSQTWNGTVYAGSTCGATASACVAEESAQAGRYQARMCACPAAELQAGFCVSSVCTSVPFDYPGTTTVAGTLP